MEPASLRTGDPAAGRPPAPPRRRLNLIGVGLGFPPGRQTAEEAAPSLRLGGPELRMYKRLFGLETLPYEAGAPLGELLAAALADLGRRHSGLEAGTSHIFHCHTIPAVVPVGGPFAGGSIMPAGREAASLTMSHCATGLSALALADAVLDEEGSALILIGERAFHRRIRLIADTAIMGEAAAAVVVGRQDGMFEVVATRSDHDGAWAISRGHPAEEMSFGRDYAEFVSAHIRAILSDAGVAIGDLHLVLPHNVNTISWLGIARKLGLPVERIYLDNVPRHSHCFGADPFINAMDAVAGGRAPVGALLLMVSVGMGLSAASALVRRTEPPKEDRQDVEYAI